jgi:hypothetical protein
MYGIGIGGLLLVGLDSFSIFKFIFMGGPWNQ